MADKKTEHVVSRRGLLSASAAAALGAGLATPRATRAERGRTSRFPGCDVDVVVIGGGFAGITAARDCRENGYSTLLLEARNRLGGRTFTSQFAGHRVELGGAWIHWTQPFVWAEKERYGLAVTETPGFAPERMLLRQGDAVRELGEAEVGEIVAGFSAYMAEGRAVLARPWDLEHNWDAVLAADAVSAQEHLARLSLTPLQRTAMDSFLAGTAHNRPDQMSYLDALRWSALAGYGDLFLWMDAVGRYQFREGTEALVKSMLEDAHPEIRLSTPVSAVKDLGERVRVTTARGDTITAAAAIVALPMNVLGDLDFSPALPAPIIDAARQRHTGLGVKMFIEVQGKLGKVFMMADSSNRLNNVFTYHESEHHTTLVAFGADPGAIDMYDELAVQDALREFLPEASVSSVFGYDWVLDPYSKGTYASYRPGWLHDYHDLFNRDRGRLFFGQGDHGPGWRGFIDGAIGAGSRAAQRVHRALGQGGG